MESLRWPLRVTAALNVLVGLASLADPQLLIWFTYGADRPLDPLALRFYQMLWGTVIVLGLGYGLASQDPERHRAIVVVGALGKLLVAAIWLWMWATGESWAMVLLGVAFDGGLGLLFAWKLLRAA